jgi:hypothetical protein
MSCVFAGCNYPEGDCSGACATLRVAPEAKKAALDAHRAPKAAPSALDTQVGGDHYRNMVIQPVEFNHRNGIGFVEGNVIKYVSRWRTKNGIEDLKKARHFLDLLIEMEAGNG